MNVDLTPKQKTVMSFIGEWIDQNDDLIDRETIISQMRSQGVPVSTTINIIYSLIKKGYLRRSNERGSNKAHYIKLRGV